MIRLVLARNFATDFQSSCTDRLSTKFVTRCRVKANVSPLGCVTSRLRPANIIIIIIIIIKCIYIAQVRKGHKCAMSAEMAVWLRNCLYLYSYLSHN